MKSLREYVNKPVNEKLEDKNLDKILSDFINELGIDEKEFRKLLDKENIDSKKIWHPIQLGEALMCLGFNILMGKDFKDLTKFCKHFVSLSSLINKDGNK